ncbi:hypothetical protein AB0L70_37720 [Kribbella sp. NPDC051952]|uniref:hypothetical protein n=1 Tax=Kribbella sp. NPDC051952 TaxID=3154851 RepID=UPI00341728F2
MRVVERPTGDHRWRILRVSLGLVVVALGIAGFVGLADAASEGDGLAAFDPQLTADFVAHRRAPLSTVASAVTFLGEVPVLSILTVIAALLLRAGTRRWQPGIILIVGMLGAAGLTYGLKVLIGRHRPGADVVLGHVNHGFSFPSGHSLSSAVFFASWPACCGSRARPGSRSSSARQSRS